MSLDCWIRKTGARITGPVTEAAEKKPTFDQHSNISTTNIQTHIDTYTFRTPSWQYINFAYIR